MTQLPTGWRRLPLAELGDWFGGGTPSKGRTEFWENGTVPWLSPKDMGPEVIHSTQDHITDAAVVGSSVRRVPGGSVALVVRSGILERTLPIAVVPFEVTLNQDMKALVPRLDLDARWVAWGLRSLEQELLRGCRKSGTTVASIETKSLMAQELPVPPLDEQRRIVEMLEDHLSRLDAATSVLSVVTHRLQVLELAIIDAVFIGVARQLAWPIGRLEDLAATTTRAITDGPFGSNLTNGHYTSEGARVIRLQNIGDGRFKFAEAFVSLDHFVTLEAHNVRQGDVVVASLGDQLPRAAVVPDLRGPALVKADCIRVRTRDDVDPRWLALGCRSSRAKRWAADQLHGVGRQRLGLKGIRAIPLPLPSSPEMRHFCDQIENQLEAIARMRGETRKAEARVAALRRSLLAAAFSGRLA